VNQPPNPAAEQAALPGCWWHPNRPTGLSCSRCGRPACPDCLREAPVGFQCTDCVHAGGQEQRRQHRGYQEAGFGQRTVFGARLSQSVLVTQVILAVNVLVFLFTVFQAQSLNDNDAADVFQRGSLYVTATLGHDEWWRVCVEDAGKPGKDEGRDRHPGLAAHLGGVTPDDEAQRGRQPSAFEIAWWSHRPGLRDYS